MTESVASHSPSHAAAWWGLRKLECQQSLKIELEGLRFAVTRQMNEWRFFYDQPGVSATPPASHWQQQLGDVAPDEYKEMARFMFRTTHTTLNIIPALADRPVITTPTTPLNLPPDEEVTLFVSSPLWMQVYSEGGTLPLLDIPIQRISDTWFGSSTQSGELCYASRTHGYLSLQQVPIRMHRAITPVVVKNNAGTNLLLERISLPAPNLSLYADQESRLWTETITLERESDGDMASLAIAPHPPAQLESPVRLCEPRSKLHKSSLAIRAFSVLFD